MGAAYQLDGHQVVSPRNPSRPRGGAAATPPLVQRQLLFWLAGLLLFVLMLWLLRDIMLPFVAGLAIAYLLTPITDRLERLGVNRLAAALLIITIVVLALIYLILLMAPILAGQLSSFFESVPGYITKLQSLLSDPSRYPGFKNCWGQASARTSPSAI
jgi:predicted PurR-regulated permease PerM